jgi:hypothetical protein
LLGKHKALSSTFSGRRKKGRKGGKKGGMKGKKDLLSNK